MLSIDEITMQNRDWAELKPSAHDHDVIAQYFFRPTAKKGLAFKKGKTIIYFQNKIVDAVEEKKNNSKPVIIGSTEIEPSAATDFTVYP